MEAMTPTTPLAFALKKLARRSMHSKRLYGLMNEAGYSDDECREAITYLQNQGYVNDDEYVKYFVVGWQKRGKSRREIAAKAARQCIPVFELHPFFLDDKEVVKNLIIKRYPQLLEKNSSMAVRKKALGALSRKGFSYQTVIEILNTNVL